MSMNELSRKTLALLIAFALQLTVTSAGWAASFEAGGGTASVEGENIEIGWKTWTEPNGKNDIAIGNLSEAGWNRGTAVGYFARSAGLCGAAFGASAYAYGNQSAAIGSNAAAEGHHGVAVGFFAEAKGNNSTAVGGSADGAGLEGTQALAIIARHLVPERLPLVQAVRRLALLLPLGVLAARLMAPGQSLIMMGVLPLARTLSPAGRAGNQPGGLWMIQMQVL